MEKCVKDTGVAGYAKLLYNEITVCDILNIFYCQINYTAIELDHKFLQ